MVSADTRFKYLQHFHKIIYYAENLHWGCGKGVLISPKALEHVNQFFIKTAFHESLMMQSILHAQMMKGFVPFQNVNEEYRTSYVP